MGIFKTSSPDYGLSPSMFVKQLSRISDIVHVKQLRKSWKKSKSKKMRKAKPEQQSDSAPLTASTQEEAGEEEPLLKLETWARKKMSNRELQAPKTPKELILSLPRIESVSLGDSPSYRSGESNWEPWAPKGTKGLPATLPRIKRIPSSDSLNSQSEDSHWETGTTKTSEELPLSMPHIERFNSCDTLGSEAGESNSKHQAAPYFKDYFESLPSQHPPQTNTFSMASKEGPMDVTASRGSPAATEAITTGKVIPTLSDNIPATQASTKQLCKELMPGLAKGQGADGACNGTFPGQPSLPCNPTDSGSGSLRGVKRSSSTKPGSSTATGLDRSTPLETRSQRQIGSSDPIGDRWTTIRPALRQQMNSRAGIPTRTSPGLILSSQSGESNSEHQATPYFKDYFKSLPSQHALQTNSFCMESSESAGTEEAGAGPQAEGERGRVHHGCDGVPWNSPAAEATITGKLVQKLS
ncbi:protein SPT2 homolog [Heliangelus exortis]|uniref:protein SPT2 homolog n=1 Tax=Heliangelus exortis TaxID=472823 RepID=UPI003A933C1A